MSDLKRTCPACDSETSAIGMAFRDGEPCPYCGLPAEAAEAVIRARRRGAAEDVLERMARAEARAARAEARLARLLGAVDDIERAAREARHVGLTE